jgi:hypothetical protein
MKQEQAFMQALGATLSVGAEPTLPPERVNLIGAALGLNEHEVFALAMQLQRQGLVQFHRTQLGLTDLGRGRLLPASGIGPVSQQGGINIVQQSGSIHLGGNVSGAGPGASPQGSPDRGAQLGALAAALAELRQLAESLRPEERQPVHRLEAEVSAAMQEVEDSGSTGDAVVKSLARVDEALSHAISIGQLAGKLAPARQLLGSVLEWFYGFLGRGG